MARSAQSRRYPIWILLLSAVGALALVAVVLSLFFTLGRRPQKFEVVDAPAADSPEFLRSVAGTAGTPLRSGGSVRLLDNGAFFPALLQAVAKAQHTINFTVYIWEPGRMSDQLFAALVERARAGVEIRLLLDGVGCIKVPEQGVEALQAAGGRVARFRTPQVGKFTRFHKRTHRRSIVIDGTVGFTGGEAIADKWLGNASNPQEWRDFMIEVTGPLAATLQSAFVPLWSNTTGEILSGPDVFPAMLDGAPPLDDNAHEALLHVGVASSPTNENHPLRLFFLQTFAAARRRLYITTPYFVPPRAAREIVAMRARKGVDVRILMPNEQTDARLIRLTSHSYYTQLLEAGVRIYEYQPTMMHGKSVVVDGVWTVVGSANLDVRSEELNEENVLGIWNPEFALRMEETFLGDLQYAREIRLDEWRRRGHWESFKEWLASRPAEQY
jgi:cardiolipin synthase